MRTRIGQIRANRSGSGFQKVVLQSAAMQPSVVQLRELPPCGGRYVGPNKFVAEKMPCDFIGVLKGSPLFFDAKRCGVKSAHFDSYNEEQVRTHQREFLKRMHDAGAIAGFLVDCERTGEYLWLPGFVLGKYSWDDPNWFRLGSRDKLLNFSMLWSYFGGLS